MTTPSLPPDPEQILPPQPASRGTLLGLAAGVVIVIVVSVVLLKAMMKPESPAVEGGPTLPVLGAANAPLTLYEYASLGCAHCAKIRPVVKEVLSRYEGRVKLVFVHFPRGPQQVSEAAVKAGHCAAKQGKFWEFAELAFDRQTSWSADPGPMALLTLYAGQVGVDTNQFLACVESPEAAQALGQLIMMGASQMVQTTPTFLIGRSRLVNPQKIEEFIAVIDRELAALNANAAK